MPGRKERRRILSFLLHFSKLESTRLVVIGLDLFLRNEENEQRRSKILHTLYTGREEAVVSNSIDNKIMQVGACCTAERVP